MDSADHDPGGLGGKSVHTVQPLGHDAPHRRGHLARVDPPGLDVADCVADQVHYAAAATHPDSRGVDPHGAVHDRDLEGLRDTALTGGAVAREAVYLGKGDAHKHLGSDAHELSADQWKGLPTLSQRPKDRTHGAKVRHV